jgi:pyridoxal phosphate enzyme (YggS family)
VKLKNVFGVPPFRRLKCHHTSLVCYIIVVSDLLVNLSAVQGRIEAAAARVGRDASEVKLVAVSKTHPAGVLREAMAAGAVVFGENKVQEAESKIVEIGRESAEWHLIGHLQSNKARKAVQLFDVIQSVDSLELAQRLERICLEEGRLELSVFAQVDLAGEETKSGIAESDLPELAEFLKRCERLKFDGLMAVPPYFENADDVRPFFKRLRAIRDELLSDGSFANNKGELSMGMSHDFEIAVEEGATAVRVGTAIFGEREYTK